MPNHLSAEMINRFPREILNNLYWNEKMTITNISQKCGVGVGTIGRLIQYYKIKTRRYESIPSIKCLSNDAVRGYFAGYIDGDGSILVTITKAAKAFKGFYPRPYVNLVSVHGWFIAELHEKIGGGIRSFKYKDSRENKIGWKIQFSNHAAILRFLTEIEPFLVLKQKQARLVIEFCKNRIKSIRENGRSARISDRCWEIAKEVRLLNG